MANDIPPASFGLGFDPFRYGAVGQDAYFAGDIEKARAFGHLNSVTVGAERGGNGIRRVANIHARRSLGLIGSGQSKGLFAGLSSRDGERGCEFAMLVRPFGVSAPGAFANPRANSLWSALDARHGNETRSL